MGCDQAHPLFSLWELNLWRGKDATSLAAFSRQNLERSRVFFKTLKGLKCWISGSLTSKALKMHNLWVLTVNYEVAVSFSPTWYQLIPAVIIYAERLRVKYHPCSSLNAGIPVVCVVIHHERAASAFHVVKKKCCQIRGSHLSSFLKGSAFITLSNASVTQRSSFAGIPFML